MKGTASPSEFTLTHDSLGEIVGLQRQNGVVQFRGIPYARIPGRFRQSICSTSLPYNPFAAKEPGYTCPTPDMPYPEYIEGPLHPDGVPFQVPEANEFNCLNLNITVPEAALEQSASTKLPVLVFIHGGAFIGGSSSIQVAGREIYDGFNLVRKSIARGQPIVFVSINYRVGVLGFLTSRELQAINVEHKEALGNYGLHDQRQALEWCHQFIAGFGGDPDQVTISGSSAGASSCEYQIRYPQPKFRRAVCASGTMVGIGPESLGFHQAIFQHIFENVSGDATSTDKAQSVLAVNVADLLMAYPGFLWSPFTDGTWIPEKDSHEEWNINASIDLMLGSCTFEQDIGEVVLSVPSMHVTEQTRAIFISEPSTDPKVQIAHMQRTMKAGYQSSRILRNPTDFPWSEPDALRAYELGTDLSMEDPEVTLYRHAQLMCDVVFRYPPVVLAQNLNIDGRIFFYDLQSTNPYPNWPICPDKANHAANDIFLFDVASDLVPDAKQEDFCGAVEEITAAWLDFTYGKQPWRPINKGSKKLGPVFAFRNGGKGAVFETLDQALTQGENERFAALKKACI